MIQGVGPKTISKLIIKYGSIDRVMQANEKELSEIIGRSKAKLILAKRPN